MAVGQNRSVSVPFWGWQSHLLCSSKTLAGCSVSGLWPTPTYLSLVGKSQRNNNLSPQALWKWRAKSSDALLSEAHLAGFVVLPRFAALSWLPLHKMNLAPSPLSVETAALCRDCRVLKPKALGSSWQHSASMKDLPTPSPMDPIGPRTRSKQDPWRSLKGRILQMKILLVEIPCHSSQCVDHLSRHSSRSLMEEAHVASWWQ